MGFTCEKKKKKKSQELSSEVSLFSESTAFDELKIKIVFQLAQVSASCIYLSFLFVVEARMDNSGHFQGCILENAIKHLEKPG